MTEQEIAALIAEGQAIDSAAQAHAEAAACGNLDEKGQIIAPPSPEAVIEEKAAGWFLVPKTIAWAITTVFPETAPHYTDEACMNLARAIVPVAEKYGLDGIEASPEIMLLFAAGAFGAPGYIAYRKRKADAERAEHERVQREDGRADGG